MTFSEAGARGFENGLVEKRTPSDDRRAVLLGITPRGRRLAVAHRTELRATAAALIQALRSLAKGSA